MDSSTLPSIDFTNLEYLKRGSSTQVAAYQAVKGIVDKLEAFQPILTGTVPIGVDIPSSDLDIICCCDDLNRFATVLEREFSSAPQFALVLETAGIQCIPCVRANFVAGGWEVEIFGQKDTPTTRQNAYLHMIIEHKVLQERGEEFRKDVVALKSQGIKTEPAFVKLLGLGDGSEDPYSLLLRYGQTRGCIEH